MTAINFPLSTAPGQRPQEGARRLINCYAEPRGESTGAVWHRDLESVRNANSLDAVFNSDVFHEDSLSSANVQPFLKLHHLAGASCLSARSTNLEGA